MNFSTWQFKADQDAVMLRNAQPILVIGGWLLSFLAITGVAALAAGRAAEQTRRAGLLKAVGATPGLIAAVLLIEYLVLALLGDALGLGLARLAEPAIASPTASRIGDCRRTDRHRHRRDDRPRRGGGGAVGPASHAAGPAHRDRHRPGRHHPPASPPSLADRAVRAAAHPAAARAAADRPPAGPRRAPRVLHRRHPDRDHRPADYGVQPRRGYAQHREGWERALSSMPNLRDDHDSRLLLAVTVLVITLALVNTVTLTWTTAIEARANMAIARTLGATPGQITAGLSVAQLLPALSGALAGILMGIVLYGPYAGGGTAMPPLSWLLAAALAVLLATAALTALPARLAARRPVAQTLSAETA